VGQQTIMDDDQCLIHKSLVSFFDCNLTCVCMFNTRQLKAPCFIEQIKGFFLCVHIYSQGWIKHFDLFILTWICVWSHWVWLWKLSQYFQSVIFFPFKLNKKYISIFNPKYGCFKVIILFILIILLSLIKSNVCVPFFLFPFPCLMVDT